MQTSDMRHPTASTRRAAPGLAVAGTAALIAWGISTAAPAIPLLTASVALGILVAQLPTARPALTGVLQPGLGAAVRLGPLLRTGWRALLVALLSWALVATLAWAAVQVA